MGLDVGTQSSKYCIHAFMLINLGVYGESGCFLKNVL